ncbi:hypothetical protein ANN_01359 [Periplaneta americana]|uniref:Uncharacterized protein n=1 Tax=Periplaneta americana TaxID=6978 RepID=A0ABQ8TTC3_PERAM|nr:hypothetical protein ANN_01359 [Periplaneta americana]
MFACVQTTAAVNCFRYFVVIRDHSRNFCDDSRRKVQSFPLLCKVASFLHGNSIKMYFMNSNFMAHFRRIPNPLQLTTLSFAMYSRFEQTTPFVPGPAPSLLRQSAFGKYHVTQKWKVLDNIGHVPYIDESPFRHRCGVIFSVLRTTAVPADLDFRHLRSSVVGVRDSRGVPSHESRELFNKQQEMKWLARRRRSDTNLILLH